MLDKSIAQCYYAHVSGTQPADSEPPQGVQKGEVNMATPNASELLVEKTERALLLELLRIVDKANTVEDIRKALEERLTASK